MKALTISFRELERAHRRERATDARALRSGKVSARKLQERNSFIPPGARVEIINLASYMKTKAGK